jgi:hypothetical protein
VRATGSHARTRKTFAKVTPALHGHRQNSVDKLSVFLTNSTPLNGSESGGGLFPATFFAPSGPAIPKSKLSEEEEKWKDHEIR